MRTLPPRQRAVLTLRYAADLTHGEIAVALDCSEEAARRAASDGLKTLREELCDVPASARPARRRGRRACRTHRRPRRRRGHRRDRLRAASTRPSAGSSSPPRRAASCASPTSSRTAASTASSTASRSACRRASSRRPGAWTPYDASSTSTSRAAAATSASSSTGGLVGSPFARRVLRGRRSRSRSARRAPTATSPAPPDRRTAYRAAGNALGANPIPIVVPCHRVLASTGGLGGYTGGLDRKRLLLGIEGAARRRSCRLRLQP